VGYVDIFIYTFIHVIIHVTSSQQNSYRAADHAMQYNERVWLLPRSAGFRLYHRFLPINAAAAAGAAAAAAAAA
jgi:hypothetical protein